MLSVTCSIPNICYVSWWMLLNKSLTRLSSDTPFLRRKNYGTIRELNHTKMTQKKTNILKDHPKFSS